MKKGAGVSTPTLEDSDYEVFTPMTAGGCLNGREESYVRRKRDAACFNGESFDRTIYDVVNCPCTREDYEWSFPLFFLIIILLFYYCNFNFNIFF